eukprot:XP_001704698.1 Hypothetical protein GL50803_29429 [Giardia lamblia ATCC 50803]
MSAIQDIQALSEMIGQVPNEALDEPVTTNNTLLMHAIRFG